MRADARHQTANVTTVRHLDGMPSLAGQWRELSEASRRRSPFTDFDFVANWYRCFVRPDDVRILCLSDASGPIGLLPLALRKRHGLRCLVNLTNDHCFHGDPLVRQGAETLFPEAVLRELLRDRSSWDMLEHRFTYSFSLVPGLFPPNLLRREKALWTAMTRKSYQIELNKTFDRYLREDVGDKIRKNYRAYLNKLAKSGSVTFHSYHGVEAAARWHDFVRIENAGWKGERDSSIASLGRDFQKYYDGLVRLLAERDLLRLYFLALDGTAIAGVFGYREGEIFHWAKTGYDEEYKGYSPSNMLLLKIVEHLIEHEPGIRTFHMFPWDYNYKHRYSNSSADCFETILYNRTVRGEAKYLVDRAKAHGRSLLGPWRLTRPDGAVNLPDDGRNGDHARHS